MPFWKWTCPHCNGAYYEHEKKHNLGRIASSHERRCNDRNKETPPHVSVDLVTLPTVHEAATGLHPSDFDRGMVPA